MAIKLLPHQSYAVDYFTKGRERILNGKNAKDDGKFTIKDGQSWLLADGPRVGKTLASVGIDERLRQLDDVYYGNGTACTLIICPKRIRSVWSEAIHDYYDGKLDDEIMVIDLPKREKIIDSLATNDLPMHTFYIINYDALPKLVDELKSIKWFHIIVDECHNMKGRNTARTKVWKSLKTRHKGLTSGTPADNAAQDMWVALNWILPKEFSSYWRFIDQCFHTYTHPKKGFKIIKGVNKASLKEFYWDKLEGHYLRRTLADVKGSIPDVTYREISVPMTKEQARTYIELEEDEITELDSLYGEGSIDLLPAYTVELYNRFQQLAIGECVVREEQVWSDEHNIWFPKHKLFLKPGRSPKLDAFVEFAKEDGNPLVVFAQHNDTSDKLYDQLVSSKISAVRYRGEDEEKAQFKQGAVQVIVGTFGSMREGHDLAVENGGTVCFIDRASRTLWNVQAMYRVQNIMMDTPLHVIDFTTYILGRKTIDQTRQERYSKKLEGIELLTNRNA